MPNDLKHIQASFSLISTDWLCLQVAQMPTCRDLAMFAVTTTANRLLYPCACARGKNMENMDIEGLEVTELRGPRRKLHG